MTGRFFVGTLAVAAHDQRVFHAQLLLTAAWSNAVMAGVWFARAEDWIFIECTTRLLGSAGELAISQTNRCIAETQTAQCDGRTRGLYFRAFELLSEARALFDGGPRR